jgi:putative chitinase
VITADILKKIFNHAEPAKIDIFLGPLNETMAKYEINTPLREAHFLAQVGHESGELRYVRELASGQAYDVGRLAASLGNTPEDDDDGERYKGRGLIQITGTANYKALSKDLGCDFLANPERLEEPAYAAMSAGWFWNKRKLNRLADLDDLKRITKRINGGLNGLEDRKRIYELAKTAIDTRGTTS